MYALALLSVVVVGGYWGWFFAVRRPHGTATFGAMQLAAAGLCALGLIGRRYEGEWLDVAGAIGLGAGTCLLVVGPLIRAFARRLAGAERLVAAARLLDVAEVLAPGSGVSDEKALIAAMREIRDGRIDETVGALTAAKDRAPAEARFAIDERIAMLYLAAYRWNDAIAHAEAHLFGAPLEPLPAESTEAVPLRKLLGVSPPVWVELVGAYGRTGDLDRAARMLTRLEQACEGRPDAALWVHRARLMFLALAGRPAAVQALLSPRHARHMSSAARTYWVAVAYQAHGDRDAATAAYEKARNRSRGRPRELIDEALAQLARNDGASVRLSSATSEIVARIEAAPLPAPIEVQRRRGLWATWSIAGVMVAIAMLIASTLGSTGDLGALTRSGALVRGLVDSGEWWRIFSSILVHAGSLHLLVNVIGMVVIGRIAEEIFGTAKTIAMFGLCGFAGAAASYMASPGGMSYGASGALFGLLGALFVELSWHRERYRHPLRPGLWGSLVFAIVAQLGFAMLHAGHYLSQDASAPYGGVVGLWAYGAGLIAGAVLGAVLSPHAAWHHSARNLGRGLAAVVIGFVAIAGYRVTTTSLDRSFSRAPRIKHVVDRVAVEAPANWTTNANELSEPDGLVGVTLTRAPYDQAMGELATWSKTPPFYHRQDWRVVEGDERSLSLPDGWQGVEWSSAYEDALGYIQRYRVIICGHTFGDEMVVAMIHAPESLARSTPQFLARLLTSVRPN
ncbi:MAG: rhomboid family intramembrane serine protease [Kofleriaceae bacterium]